MKSQNYKSLRNGAFYCWQKRVPRKRRTTNNGESSKVEGQPIGEVVLFKTHNFEFVVDCTVSKRDCEETLLSTFCKNISSHSTRIQVDLSTSDLPWQRWRGKSFCFCGSPPSCFRPRWRAVSFSFPQLTVLGANLSSWAPICLKLFTQTDDTI